MHEIIFVGLLSYAQLASPTPMTTQVISRRGTVSGRQEQPGAARSSPGQPRAAWGSGQELPGAARDRLGSAGAASSEKEREKEYEKEGKQKMWKMLWKKMRISMCKVL